MILCVNLNAAIDKTVVVKDFQLNHIHRPELVKALPGGKGCNVARALKRLGETPVVTGWVGGFAGQFIETNLQAEGIHTDFVHTQFDSRTCLSIIDPQKQTLTEIYENGERLSARDIDALRSHFQGIVGRCHAVTFSGSIPPGAPDAIYAELVAISKAANIPTYLDSSKEPLRLGLAAGPFLIKPNKSEVMALVDRHLEGESDFAQAALQISTHNNTIVVLSLGAEGALGAWQGQVCHVQNPRVAARSAVGSGDSMLAGLVYGFTHGMTFEEALIHGVAAGTANTLTLGAGVFSLQDFEQVRAQTKLQKMLQ